MLDVIGRGFQLAVGFAHFRNSQLQYSYSYARGTYIYHVADIERIYFQPERFYLVWLPYTVSGVHCEEAEDGLQSPKREDRMVGQISLVLVMCY